MGFMPNPASSDGYACCPLRFFLALKVYIRILRSLLKLNSKASREVETDCIKKPVSIMNSIMATPPPPHQLYNARLAPSRPGR